ncbi:hypothetical protein BHE74_00019074 [Ensete ventricosum]|nr:hypothetical protein BHE74_00019074 [Ensete ventricosum]RZS21043.1 hypothetical protein BHM03_00053633 [Ensete ventricosum]
MLLRSSFYQAEGGRDKTVETEAEGRNGGDDDDDEGGGGRAAPKWSSRGKAPASVGWSPTRTSSGATPLSLLRLSEPHSCRDSREHSTAEAKWESLPWRYDDDDSTAEAARSFRRKGFAAPRRRNVEGCGGGFLPSDAVRMQRRLPLVVSVHAVVTCRRSRAVDDS